MILSSASCTLTPPCPCKAEPCYNKIQGYKLARCCQTPSEFHLKDLVVFCSPADMIKLELQIESPTAKVYMLYCSSYTVCWGLFIKIKVNQEEQQEKSHSSLFLLRFCFLHLLSSIFKSMSFTATHFKVQINRALIIWRCNFDRSLLSPAVIHAILDAFSLLPFSLPTSDTVHLTKSYSLCAPASSQKMQTVQKSTNTS